MPDANEKWRLEQEIGAKKTIVVRFPYSSLRLLEQGSCPAP
jgi:hypothetical protein